MEVISVLFEFSPISKASLFKARSKVMLLRSFSYIRVRGKKESCSVKKIFKMISLCVTSFEFKVRIIHFLTKKFTFRFVVAL